MPEETEGLDVPTQPSAPRRARRKASQSASIDDVLELVKRFSRSVHAKVKRELAKG